MTPNRRHPTVSNYYLRVSFRFGFISKAITYNMSCSMTRVAQIAPTFIETATEQYDKESEPFCRDLINKAQRTILHPWNLPFELLAASDLSVLISHKFSLCTQHESFEVSYQSTTAWFLHIFEPTQKFWTSREAAL